MSELPVLWTPLAKLTMWRLAALTRIDGFRVQPAEPLGLILESLTVGGREQLMTALPFGLLRARPGRTRLWCDHARPGELVELKFTTQPPPGLEVTIVGEELWEE